MQTKGEMVMSRLVLFSLCVALFSFYYGFARRKRKHKTEVNKIDETRLKKYLTELERKNAQKDEIRFEMIEGFIYGVVSLIFVFIGLKPILFLQFIILGDLYYSVTFLMIFLLLYFAHNLGDVYEEMMIAQVCAKGKARYKSMYL